MSQFKYAVFLLIFFICSHVYALDPGSRSAREAVSRHEIACPARDFSEFITVFSENTEVQIAFTKYPLKKQRLDLDTQPEPISYIENLVANQIRFPILPLQEERIKRLLELRIDTVTVNNAKVTLLKPNTDYQLVYEFGIDEGDCWHLISIDDQSLAVTKTANSNWIENLFPSMYDCTPYTFYFDLKTKKSSNSFLEKNGYSPYSIDKHLAKYKIREKFFGFDATEISIPSGTDSIYTITIQASSKDLAKIINKKTGSRPHIYKKEFQPQSAFAYLVPEGKDKSTLICFTSDEGGF